MFLPFRALCLPMLLLLAVSAPAQIITAPARSLAARDTLLQEARLLRQRVEQCSGRFQTNAYAHPRKRTVVSGVVDPRLVAPVGAPGPPLPGAPQIRWKHVTTYRRNGRVLESFGIRLNGNLLLDERRLNGQVRWLAITGRYANPLGLAVRHRGRYLQAGYLFYDTDQYALPPGQ